MTVVETRGPAKRGITIPAAEKAVEEERKRNSEASSTSNRMAGESSDCCSRSGCGDQRAGKKRHTIPAAAEEAVEEEGKRNSGETTLQHAGLWCRECLDLQGQHLRTNVLLLF